jgi:hypothetical protein
MNSPRKAHFPTLRFLTEHRFFLLFIFLLATLIAYPYTEHSGFGSYAFRILSFTVIALSVYVVRFRSGLVVFTILLAIPALEQRMVHLHPRGSVLAVVSLVLSFAFDLWIVVAIFRRVFTNVRINSETIFGALCVYLLNGISFASIYGLIADLQTGAFFLDPAVNHHTVLTRFDFIYYSFGMMTQLGAAGMAAVSDQARSVSVIEAILGQLYLAVLISRLVGAYRMHPAGQEP